MKLPNASELFSGKDERPAPVAEVEGMLKTGTPEDVIKARLGDEGYKPEEVSRALDQAKAKIGVLGLDGAPKPPAEAPPWQTQQAPAEGQPAFGQTQEPFSAQGTPQEFPGAQAEFPKEETGTQQFAQQPQPEAQPPAAAPEPAAPTPSTGEPAPEESPWDMSPEELEGKFSESAEVQAQPQQQEQLAQAAQVSDEFKQEIEVRMMALDEKLNTLMKNSGKLEKILTEVEGIKQKHTDTKNDKKEEELGKDLDELKTNINSILEVLKTTFPPMIRTLKDLKGPSKRRKEVEHLL